MTLAFTPRMTIAMQELDGNVRSIEPELLLQQLRSKRPVTILDVRTGTEYRGPRGRIAGSRWVPLQELPSRCEVLDSHRFDPVVVVSSGGVRARRAARELMLAGFTEVSTLSGGMDRWSELRLPVEVGADSGPDHA